MQLKLDILRLVKKETGLARRRTTLTIKNKDFPIGVNFICPFCNYVSDKNKHGSAKIYGNKLWCFYCGIERIIEND